MHDGHMQVSPQSGHVEVAGAAHTCAAVRSLVKSVAGGLRACQQPEPSTEGLGGTYFFLDELGRRKAIVKPCDEEPLAPNNPKVPLVAKQQLHTHCAMFLSAALHAKCHQCALGQALLVRWSSRF